MSNRLLIDFLNDILDNLENINHFTANMSDYDFKNDKKTLYAVIRCLEIIGEAVKNIPSSMRNNYTNIPWRDIAGMRDVLIHDYFGIDIETIWNTVKIKIPEILPLIRNIINDLKQ